MSDRKHKVAVLGILAIDLTFRTDRIPTVDETVKGHGFLVSWGGKGSNQAIAAARCGAEVTFISKVGYDAYFDSAAKIWEKEGIKASVIRSQNEQTGFSFINVDNLGDNTIIVSPGVADSFTCAEIDCMANSIATASVFITQLELPIATVKCGLEIAKKNNTATILNATPTLDQPSSALDDCLSLTDYLIVNMKEAAVISEKESVTSRDHASEAAQNFFRRGVRRAVLIKNDAHDSVYVIERLSKIGAHGSSIEIVPFDAIVAPKDKTGSMDAFSGGFAAALAEGFDLLKSVRFASQIASVSENERGAASSMPDLHKVKDALRATSNKEIRQAVEDKSISGHIKLTLSDTHESNNIIDGGPDTLLSGLGYYSFELGIIIEKNKHMGLDAYNKIYGFLQEQGIHDEDTHELVMEFRRNVEIARNKRLTKWNDRSDDPALAKLSTIEFLKTVYRHLIRNNTVDKSEIRQIDPVLMKRVEQYISNSMKNNGHAGEASDLKFLIEHPAQNSVRPSRNSHLKKAQPE